MKWKIILMATILISLYFLANIRLAMKFWRDTEMHKYGYRVPGFLYFVFWGIPAVVNSFLKDK